MTPHFRLSEFTASDTARDLGIENTPTAEHLPNIQKAAEGMERIRSLLGDKPITVTSGYRNPQVNAAVGGVPNSAHALGHAVDFKCPGFGSPYQIVELLMNDAAFMADVDQLIFEFNAWVHVSFDPRKRGQVLTAHRIPGQSGTKYVAGLQQVDGNGHLLA